MPAICPQCGSGDSAQAVRAIVAAQTSHSVGVTNSVGVAYGRGGLAGASAVHRTSATTRTSLAGMLNLPPVRVGAGMWLWGLVLLVVGVVFGLVFFVASASSTPDPKSPIPHHTMAILVGVVVSLPFWLPGLVLAALGLRRRHRYKREAPMRGHMAALWNQATYCHRDDVVYLPDGTWTPPQEFRPMLRAQAIRATA